jgi:prefoldin subunit 5
MEPQDNKKLALGKAVSAHEQAEAALSDLTKDVPDPRYEQMIARIQQNLQELRADAATSPPGERV